MVFVIGCVSPISDLLERVIFLFGIDIWVFLCGNTYNSCIQKCKYRLNGLYCRDSYRAYMHTCKLMNNLLVNSLIGSSIISCQLKLFPEENLTGRIAPYILNYSYNFSYSVSFSHERQ